MSDAVTNALKRKKELESELRQIEIFLAMHSRFSGTEREDHEIVNSRPSVLSAVDAAFGRERGRPKEFARFMMAILEDYQRPLTRTQLVEELEARGHAIPAQDKARYVGTVLWRHDRAFINLQGKGYWLRAKPCKDAEYVPSASDPLLAPTREYLL